MSILCTCIYRYPLKRQQETLFPKLLKAHLDVQVQTEDIPKCSNLWRYT